MTTVDRYGNFPAQSGLLKLVTVPACAERGRFPYLKVRPIDGNVARKILTRGIQQSVLPKNLDVTIETSLLDKMKSIAQL